MARILNGNNESDIFQAAHLLSKGGLVALPTETVYGLAADATNEDAVKQVFAIKGRPLIDPLIVHVQGIQDANTYAELCPIAYSLAETFWPGPLMLVLPKKNIIPDIVTAGQASVAIRSPLHPVARKLILHSGKPLAAPSANPFGYISPTTAKHVQDNLGNLLDIIIDGGPCEHGLESTILSLLNPSKPIILRPGPLSPEAIESCLKIKIEILDSSKNDTDSQQAPGMLSRHYSPNTRLILSENPAELCRDEIHRISYNNTHDIAFENHKHSVDEKANDRIALLFLTKPANLDELKNTNALKKYSNIETFWCTESSDLKESARFLFGLLRTLDVQNFSKIIVQKAPQSGIGIAINNRLSRAASKI